jgi:hypothetical protein
MGLGVRGKAGFLGDANIGARRCVCPFCRPGRIRTGQTRAQALPRVSGVTSRRFSLVIIITGVNSILILVDV